MCVCVCPCRRSRYTHPRFHLARIFHHPCNVYPAFQGANRLPCAPVCAGRHLVSDAPFGELPAVWVWPFWRVSLSFFRPVRWLAGRTAAVVAEDTAGSDALGRSDAVSTVPKIVLVRGVWRAEFINEHYLGWGIPAPAPFFLFCFDWLPFAREKGCVCALFKEPRLALFTDACGLFGCNEKHT